MILIWYALMNTARWFAEMIGHLHYALGKLAVRAEYHYRLTTG